MKTFVLFIISGLIKLRVRRNKENVKCLKRFLFFVFQLFFLIFSIMNYILNVEKKWKVIFSLVNRNSEMKWENRSLLEISPPSLMWNDWCVINRNYYSNKFVVKWSAGCRVPDLWTILYVMDFYVLLSFLYIENLLR